MAKFCGKCGSRLDEITGLCPKCDAERLVELSAQSTNKAEKQEVDSTPEKSLSKKDIKRKKKADKKVVRKIKKKEKRAQWSTGKKVRRFFLKLILNVLLLAVLIVGIVGTLVYFDIVEIPAVSNILGKTENDEEANYSPQITLRNFSGDCYEIPLTEEKNVLFTVEVSDKVADDLIVVETVNGESLGYMNDAGRDGDLQAGDGIYSRTVKLSSDVVGNVSFRATYFKATSNEFDIVFYTEITSEEYLKFEDIYSQVSNCSSSEEIEMILKSADCIEEYVFQNDSVTFRTDFGMTGIYEWNCNQNVKGMGQYAVPDASGIDYIAAKENAENSDFEPASVVLRADVAVLRPFRTSQFTYDDFMYAGQILSDFTTGQMDCIDDSQVTVETMKSLDNYKLTLIDSHGTLSNITNSAWNILDTDPYILTGEEYTAYGMWSSADWQAGRIVVCGTSIFYGKGYVAVGAKFFDRYYNYGDLDGSMFFLGTCYSTKNDSIANVLIEKGAEVVYGYSDPVYTTYCNATLFETVINCMLLSESTANDAFTEAKRIYGETDPYNSNCEYKMYGNADYKIVSEKTITTSDERDIVLVLDVSGSMSGTPMEETKKASINFIETVLEKDASIGIVTYDNSANRASDFSVNKSSLENIVSGIYDGGGTNIEAGLREAQDMFGSSNAKKKIIVLMSDGEPNDGKEGDELVAYANEIKDSGVLIYTLGFFGNLDGAKSSAQVLMERIASDGCHYEVANADDLVFFFEDMADQINGQKYIYVRIACPVDVSVTYKGQTLNSAEDDLNLRTDFGTLTFEENEEAGGDGTDDRVKVLRLKEGADYDLQLVGTGHGLMDYTIGFMDDEGNYSDLRKFENVKITKRTVIDTVAANSKESILNIDENGDGKYELRLRAGENGYGEEIKWDYLIYLVVGGCAVLLVVGFIIAHKVRTKKKEKVK